jgi:hypothetical protein
MEKIRCVCGEMVDRFEDRMTASARVVDGDETSRNWKLVTVWKCPNCERILVDGTV